MLSFGVFEIGICSGYFIGYIDDNLVILGKIRV